MLYNGIGKIVHISILLLCISHTCHAARVFVKNWSSSTVTITNIVTQPSAGSEIDTALKNSIITVQPGHSQQITAMYHDMAYDNVSKFTMTYHLQEHAETETVYFPASAEQETSFYFTDGGYDRFPYNTSNLPVQQN